MLVPILIFLIFTSLGAAETFNSTTMKTDFISAGVPQQELTICWIWEDDTYYGPYSRIAAAVDLAVTNANRFVLPHSISVKLVYQNSGSSCARTMYSAVDSVYSLLVEKDVHCNVFLGAGCAYTAAAIYGFAHKLDIPVLGCPAVGWWVLQPDSKIQDFPLSIMATFGYSQLSDFFYSFLTMEGYVHLTIFRDDSYAFYSVLSESLMRYIREKNPLFSVNTIVSPFLSKKATTGTYRELLTTANQRSRVFVLLLHGDSIRDMMVVASDLGFTKGEHIYIAFELYKNEYWGKVEQRKEDETDDVAIKAYQSLLLVTFENEDYFNEDDEFENKVKVLAKNSYGYRFGDFEKLDPIVVGHYESIMLYANMVTALSDERLDFTNGTLLAQRMRNTSFNGTTGVPIYISASGERDKNYNIKHYSGVTKSFEVYIHYKQHSSWNQSFRVVRDIVWPGQSGSLPADEPHCGYLNDKCKLEGLPSAILAIAIALPIILVILLTLAGTYIYFKVILKTRAIYNPNWWRIPIEEMNCKQIQIRSSGSKGSQPGLQSEVTVRTTGASSHVSWNIDNLAIYKGERVAYFDVYVLNKLISKELSDELYLVKTIDCINLLRVIGIAIDTQMCCHYIVTDVCPKGTLTTVIENESIQLDWLFKNAIIRDLVTGMTYLHSTPIQSHGNLTSETCLIDMRFTLKISDYGLPYFRPKEFLEPPSNADDNRILTPLLWRAPELLRQTMPPKGTQKGDVYSFAIILQQIILRSGPFELPSDPLELSEKEILREVIAFNIPAVRPRVPRSSCSNELYDLLERCWGEFPLERPTFQKIKDGLRKVIGNGGENLVDQLLKRMDQYATSLEQKVAEQTQQFMDEKNRSNQLLCQLLPKTVAALLIKGESVEPEAYDCISVYFSDIVGFTTIASKRSPMEVVNLLNNLYTYFDNILDQFDVYKVETIGDSYMVASGLPKRNGNKHASEIAMMALKLQRNIGTFEVPNCPEQGIQIRSGINSGSAVAGIVGLKMPRYCLFGDTVNVASRMESTGEPGRIQITDETRKLLLNIGNFETIERGHVTVKGKGTMVTYWLF